MPELPSIPDLQYAYKKVRGVPGADTPFFNKKIAFNAHQEATSKQKPTNVWAAHQEQSTTQNRKSASVLNHLFGTVMCALVVTSISTHSNARTALPVSISIVANVIVCLMKHDERYLCLIDYNCRWERKLISYQAPCHPPTLLSNLPVAIKVSIGFQSGAHAQSFKEESEEGEKERR